MILKITYDDYNHAEHYCAYVKLSKIMYIYKLSKKLIIYILHCSTC